MPRALMREMSTDRPDKTESAYAWTPAISSLRPIS